MKDLEIHGNVTKPIRLLIIAMLSLGFIAALIPLWQIGVESTNMVNVAKAHDVILEYNLNGRPWDKLHDIHTYPHPLFWQMAGKANCKAIVGYDAHFPQAFEQWEDEYQYGMDHLKQWGCTLVDSIPLGKYKK